MAGATRKQRRITNEAIDESKPAYRVMCRRFNGLTHFCELTGYPISTAYRWLVAGYIPPQRRSGEAVHPRILSVAAENEITMAAADFVEQPANDQDSSPTPGGDSAAAAIAPSDRLPPPVAAAHPSATDATSDA